MKKTFQLVGDSIVFKSEGKEVFGIRCRELLGFSDSLPWEISPVEEPDIFEQTLMHLRSTIK
jgi:hypothetical protein